MKKHLLLSVFVILLMGVAPTKVGAQADGFYGEVKLFAGNYPPRNWAFCEGQLLQISQHSALYSIIGITYGGDGRISFALPDLRGRVPVGVGIGPGLSSIRDGEKQGSEYVTLNTAELPIHKHSLENVVEVDVKTSPGTNNTDTKKVLSPVNTNGSTTVTTQNSGGSQPISIKQPSLGMHYIICLSGLWPSRD